MRQSDRGDHLRIVSSADEASQAPRPSAGRIVLEIIAWIAESDWRIAALIGGALLLGSVAGVILP